ncbi:MAG: hypothetical protein WBW88_00630 [Rhodothermales bacterium]
MKEILAVVEDAFYCAPPPPKYSSNASRASPMNTSNSFRDWQNSDLFVRKVSVEKGSTDIVVTPPYSYISPGRNARTKKILIVGDELFTFWTGRKKVGQTLDAFGYKNQIFFAKFDL